MTFGDENRPRPLRFSDVVSTSDDGDQRYGMMTTAMGGEDAAYEMEDANDIVMDEDEASEVSKCNIFQINQVL